MGSVGTWPETHAFLVTLFRFVHISCSHTGWFLFTRTLFRPSKGLLMTPPDSLSDRLFDTLCSIPLIDPHTHIDPLSPHCESLADILTYHYYTELVHSAGMPREVIEHPDLSAKEKLSRLRSEEHTSELQSQ